MSLWIVFLVPTVLLFGLVLPLWLVFHYLTKWREQKWRNAATAEDMQALWRIAEKLEERMDTLEHVVDDADRPRHGHPQSRSHAPSK